MDQRERKGRNKIAFAALAGMFSYTLLHSRIYIAQCFNSTTTVQKQCFNNFLSTATQKQKFLYHGVTTMGFILGIIALYLFLRLKVNTDAQNILNERAAKSSKMSTKQKLISVAIGFLVCIIIMIVAHYYVKNN